MSKYNLKGLNSSGDRCLKCAKPIDPKTAPMLEYDQRICAYHDRGGIPEEYNQGGFYFGPDCAKLMIAEALPLLAKLK